MGGNCSILDLKKAYLQIHVDPDLYSYQAIVWNGEIYLLTRLGFGLSCAPKIMTSIVEKVLSVGKNMSLGVSSYIDDLIVDHNTVSVDDVKNHLQEFGLEAKCPVRLGCDGGSRVLGLSVTPDLRWKRDNSIPILSSNQLTRREVHKLLGELTGHFPVVGWLRVACEFLQRCTA